MNIFSLIRFSCWMRYTICRSNAFKNIRKSGARFNIKVTTSPVCRKSVEKCLIVNGTMIEVRIFKKSQLNYVIHNSLINLKVMAKLQKSLYPSQNTFNIVPFTSQNLKVMLYVVYLFVSSSFTGSHVFKLFLANWILIIKSIMGL